MLFNDVYPILENTYYQQELNTKFWADGEFDSEIRKKLLNISKDFTKQSDLSNIDDIQLTGSLANYNYTKYSDLDVHILLDFSQINDDIDLVKQALDGKRFIWNLRHKIILRDHEVELYYQDTNEPHIASGLFSLLKNEWLREPKYNPPEIDDNDVKKKATGIITDINRLHKLIAKNVTPVQAKVLHKRATHLKDKIRNMRRSGLHKDGEFSVENLAFKQLRNTGNMGKLIDDISNAYSKIYSEQNEPVVKEDLLSFNKMFKSKEKSSVQGVGMSKSIKNILGVGDNKKGPRQQKWGTGGGRLHQNFVPDMHKIDASLNDKIETLRKTPGLQIATPTDINYCTRKYNIKDLTKDVRADDPKFLGTTGIALYYDTNKGTFVLHKP